MLTARGWWLLLVALALLTFGGALTAAPRGSGAPTLLFVALAVLLWFAWEGTVFTLRARVAARGLRLTRTLRDPQGTAVKTLWAGRPFAVELRLDLPGKLALPLAHAAEWLPPGVAVADGDPTFRGAIPTAAATTWHYRAEAASPGSVRFLGVAVHLADLQGFFHWTLFLHDELEVPVLPKLVDAEANQRGLKRINRLPPPGIHRFRSPGSGSELLELRDYQPGDPPRRIAWKVSARRDRLITREYESEVPLRLTAIVDAGSAARTGPPAARPLGQFLRLAGSLAQAAAGNRDLFGLSLVDDDHTTRVAPARGSVHLIHVLRRLSLASAAPPRVTTAAVAPLLARAYALAFDVYPELLHPAVNGMPVWLPWLTPPRSGRFGLWWLRRLWQPFKMLPPHARRTFLWRKQLAVLLASRHELPAADVARMMEDDAFFAPRLQRFLADHGVPYPPPAVASDPGGAGRRIERLAHALTRSVAGGRDNELFVLLIDLAGLDADWSPLLSAAKVARGRHHQLIVVAPGPAVEPPAEPAADATAADLLAFAAARRVAVPQRQARERFRALGVPVLFANPDESARAVLRRLDQMRALQGAIRR